MPTSNEREKPTPDKIFLDCLVAVTKYSRLCFLIEGDDQLSEMMNGDAIDDNCTSEGLATLPIDPGIYRADIEYWSFLDVRLSNIRRVL